MTRPLVDVAREVLALADETTMGPWRAVRENTEAGPMAVVRAEYVTIAMSDVSQFSDEHAFNERNAAFIASTREAAPAMAAALLDIAAVFDSSMNVMDGIRAIRDRLGLDTKEQP